MRSVIGLHPMTMLTTIAFADLGPCTNSPSSDVAKALITRTLGKVVLGSRLPAMSLGFARLDVAARMTELLEPAATQPTARHMMPLYAGVAVTAMFAIHPLHHSAKLIVTLCPG